MSGILVAGTLLMTATPAFAAENTTEGVKNLDGMTKVEITDYTVENDLPTDPGVFTLLQVPDIDFGQIALDDVAADGSTVLTGIFKDLDGDGKNDLQVKDTRPTEASKVEALGLIDKYDVTATGHTQEAKDVSSEAWNKAELASAWEIQAEVAAANDEVESIASSMTINGVEVLTAANTVVKEVATAPVGTKSYLDQVSETDPTLTLKHDNLVVKEYNGSVTYTAVMGL